MFGIVSLGSSVESIMSRGFDTIPAKALAEEAIEKIAQKSVECLVVVAENQAVGILTEQDIVTKIAANKVDPSKVYAQDIMSTPVITVRNDATVEKAAEVMTRFKVKRLVVTEASGAVAGMITTEDLTAFLSKRDGEGKGTRPDGSPSDAGGPYR